MYEARHLNGYVVSDHAVAQFMPKVKNVSPDASLRPRAPKRGKKQEWRRPMAKGLGVEVPGYAPIIPDTRHNLNQQMSVACRLAAGHKPVPRFVQRLITRIAKSAFAWSAPVSVDLSRSGYEHRLTSKGYSIVERESFLKLFDEMVDCNGQFGGCAKWNKRMLAVDGFIKEESYDQFKAPRTICSASDEHKVFFDPWLAAFEHDVFQKDFAVKFVPVKERAKFVSERLEHPALQFFATDGSKFESSHSPFWVKKCVQVLDQYFQDYPGWSDVRKNVLAHQGFREVEFNEFVFRIRATLFSGMRWTACFNLILNYLATLAVAHMSGAEVDGVFEGDDGIVVVLSGEVDDSYYKLCGIDIKFEKYDRLGDASFVGNLYSETNEVIKDPYKILTNFGWSGSQYTASNRKTLSALARSKAYSLIYELPHCPVITEFAIMVLRETEKFDAEMFRRMARKRMNAYEKEKWKLVTDSKDLEFRRILLEKTATIDFCTRLQFEKMFNMPISTQIYMEKRFRESVSRSPDFLDIDMDFVTKIFNDMCPTVRRLHSSIMYDTYVMSRPLGQGFSLRVPHDFYEEPKMSLASFF